MTDQLFRHTTPVHPFLHWGDLVLGVDNVSCFERNLKGELVLLRILHMHTHITRCLTYINSCLSLFASFIYDERSQRIIDGYLVVIALHSNKKCIPNAECDQGLCDKVLFFEM